MTDDTIDATSRLATAPRQPAPTKGIAANANEPTKPNPVFEGPILSILLRFALPNMASVSAATLVVIAETSYIGLLGLEPLAAIALVFPFVILMGMMSGGAMGGGVSSAVSRALGAGDLTRASTLALHALIIGLGGGLLFLTVMLVFGPTFFAALGGKGRVLDEATAYANVLFIGAIGMWLSNTCASILRGTGNMRLPSATLLTIAACQIAIGGTFGLGLFGLPQLGMPGVASGHLIAYTGGAAFLLFMLFSGRSRLKLNWRAFRPDRAMFADILKVGAVACLSPLQSVATVLIFTRLLSRYGTITLAGYGIGARLEFMLVPIAASIGQASLPIVGMNVGAGNVERARKVAWAAGLLSGGIIGAIGLVLAIAPDLWAARFTDNTEVLASARQYFHMAGPGFGFLGLALSLYFASQGSGKIVGPVLAQSGRLVVVVVGGLALLALDAPGWCLFLLAAASMVVYGGLAALSVWLTSWGPARPVSKPA
ncbi:cation transporter [Afipia sp. P52-10]|uniref:MATE family efflux transporter n=1 Tax=Afipia sp. P52-10 TaxID=1429916 RepID=UPI0003DF14B6|nr:MATE family efflux transporter [Afipia sp. P52-10]ETR77047.1 cation transporter [Afipia sp. P52-10]